MGHTNQDTNGQNGSVAADTKPVGISLKTPDSKETEIQKLLLQERMRLEAEYGVQAKKIDHFKKPLENIFTKDQRAETTILFGGLTWKHEKLIKRRR